MVIATGDTHGDFRRFDTEHLPQQKDMNRGDCILICGDFGGVWALGDHDRENLDFMERRPFTTLFIDGNHENFDALNEYPVDEWNGGKVHLIRPHVIHLMRGQIYRIEDHSFFTMGGGRSNDVRDGILDPEEPGFEDRYWELRQKKAMFRVKHLDWWEEEMPSQAEYAEAMENLARAENRVDFVITHCPPSSILDEMSHGRLRHDELTDFLDQVRSRIQFRRWLFGHYHHILKVNEQFSMLYGNFIQLV